MSKPKIERLNRVPEELIKELLTDSELRMVKQRFEIILLLEEGLSIRQISDRVKVGTDTVVRVARKLEGNPKIREILSNYINPPTASSKWVFGKTEE